MTDPEWKGLQESWRAQAPEQRARRHRLGARRVLLVDLAASALWFTLAASAALHSRERWVLLWALLVCLLSATALGYSLWNRRDALLPSALAPLDFLAQAELRCRRQLELHRFLLRFGAAEVVISLLLFGWAAPRLLPLATALLAPLCAGFLLWGRRAQRRARSELAEIARLRPELER